MSPNARLACAAVIAGLAVAAPARAETCPSSADASANSAFATPRPCSPVKPKFTKAYGTVQTKTPDGKTVYRTGDTELTVSGYVQGEVIVGTGKGGHAK